MFLVNIQDWMAYLGADVQDLRIVINLVDKTFMVSNYEVHPYQCRIRGTTLIASPSKLYELLDEGVLEGQLYFKLRKLLNEIGLDVSNLIPY